MLVVCFVSHVLASWSRSQKQEPEPHKSMGDPLLGIVDQKHCTVLNLKMKKGKGILRIPGEES